MLGVPWRLWVQVWGEPGCGDSGEGPWLLSLLSLWGAFPGWALLEPDFLLLICVL